MTVFSGKFGAVNGQSTVRNWSINDAASSVSFRASNSQCGVIRKTGVKAWTGGFSVNGGLPAVLPGEFFTFKGFQAPTSGVAGTTGNTYSGTALVDSLAIVWDFNANEIIQSTVAFSGHLALTEASEIVSDATTVVAPSTAAAVLEVGGTAISNIVNANLNITANNQTYVDSSTIVSGVVWTGRLAGGPDFNASVTVNNHAKQFAPQNDYILKMGVDASTEWEFRYAHLRDYSGLVVDPNTQAIQQQTMNFEKTALDPATDAIGLILKPGGAQYWPST